MYTVNSRKKLYVNYEHTRYMKYLEMLSLYTNYKITLPKQPLQRMRQVLDRLGFTGLRHKPSKCDIFKRSVKIFFHQVSGDGVGVHP